MKKLMTTIMVSLLFTVGCGQDCECEEPVNVWFKISNDKAYKFGEQIKLDMSGGYAMTDGILIYLVVLEKDTENQFVITFPIGSWIMEKIDKSKKEIAPKNQQEEFDLDEYLKKNKGKGRLIAKIK